jgi:putative oxidoreductase
MFERLERHKPQLLGLMRIAMAITFMEHGTQKLFGFPVPPPGRLALPLLLFTGLLETIGAILLTLGIFTRTVAFLISGEMAIGYWSMHVPNNFFPIANGGEVMVLYCFAFLYLAAAGPGKWSLDHRFRAA